MVSIFKTEEINPCICGFKPDHFSVYYGRTPYDIFCPTCKKQTTMAKCKVTNSHENVIDYWNEHISKLTKEDMEKETLEFRKEEKENTGYDGYKSYSYFWEKGNGPVLYKK